jgi:hypothetical protein
MQQGNTETLRYECGDGDMNTHPIIPRFLQGRMSAKQLLARTGVISLCLLGSIYNMDSRALAALRCADLPGDGRTPSGAAVAADATHFDVFIRGNDDHIYRNRGSKSAWNIGIPNSPTSWSGWSEVSGGGMTRSEPAAVWVVGPNVMLFVRGLDDRIYENVFYGSGWGGWSEVPGGGLTLSGPAAVVHNGIRKLFVRGLNDGIFENDFDGRQWSGWSELPGGGRTISTPAPVVYSYGGSGASLILFARGQDNRIYEFDFSQPIYRWVEVPGGALTLAGPSALVDPSSNTLKLFVAGIDDGVWVNNLNGSPVADGSWSGWSEASSGGAVTPSAPAAAVEFSRTPALYLTSEEGKILECLSLNR